MRLQVAHLEIAAPLPTFPPSPSNARLAKRTAPARPRRWNSTCGYAAHLLLATPALGAPHPEAPLATLPQSSLPPQPSHWIRVFGCSPQGAAPSHRGEVQSKSKGMMPFYNALTATTVVALCRDSESMMATPSAAMPVTTVPAASVPPVPSAIIPP